MKREKKELLRIQNLIENDRLNIGNGFEQLFLSDLNKILNDYFEIKDLPVLKTTKGKNGYLVEINFQATSVKIINFLPTE